MAGTEEIQQATSEFTLQSKSNWGDIIRVDGRINLRGCLLVLTGILMLINLYLIFMVAPTDAVLGHVQRIFYFHVPMAIVSFVAFLVVFLASIVYVFRRDTKWDNLAHASAEVGVVFITLALITGMIWAKPVWNAWWLWTPRLTTTLILWLIYVAYLMIRSYAPSPSKAAVYGAAVGIIGFADVVVVYFSVQWWPGIHPTPVVGPLAAAGSLNGTMRSVLLFSMLTFLGLLTYLIMERMALHDTEDKIRGIRFTLRRAARQDVLPGD